VKLASAAVYAVTPANTPPSASHDLADGSSRPRWKYSMTRMTSGVEALKQMMVSTGTCLSVETLEKSVPMKPKTISANFLAFVFSSFSHSTMPADARRWIKTAHDDSCASRMKEGAGK
jgi:hypothetical protein